MTTVNELYIPLLKEDLRAPTRLLRQKRGGRLWLAASTEAAKEVSQESL